MPPPHIASRMASQGTRATISTRPDFANDRRRAGDPPRSSAISMLTGLRKLVMARGIALTLSRRATRPCTVPDIMNPWMIPSVKVRGLGDRVLAEVDQDGF